MSIKKGLNYSIITAGPHGEVGIGCIRIYIWTDDACFGQELFGLTATIETKGVLSVYALAIADGFVDGIFVDCGIHRD